MIWRIGDRRDGLVQRDVIDDATMVDGIPLSPASCEPESSSALLRDARRIGVFRALQLGDMLCTVPALRALRRAAPQARITLIGLPWAREFARRFVHLVDDFLPFPGFPGLPEHTPAVAELPGFLRAAQAAGFDLVIQTHGSGGLSNPLAATFGARHCAGHVAAGGWCADPGLHRLWQEGEHEVRRYLQLMTHLGAPACGEHLEFPIGPSDRAALHAIFATLPDAQRALLRPQAYVCVHAGARLPSRRWPPQRFADVADRLIASGLSVVLTGSRDEAALVAQVRRHMRHEAVDLSGKTDLGALAVLVAQAAMVVCNDTGMSHIAAALGTPSVVVSSGADAARFAPLDAQRHAVLAAPAACRPCMHFSCPLPDHPCARGVSANDVWKAIQYLRGGSVHPEVHEARRSFPTAGVSGLSQAMPRSGAGARVWRVHAVPSGR